MNIVLIGMRGAGKTAVGRILAQKMERELVEIDELIARKAGMSIPRIVAEHGWEGFRDLEQEITAELSRRDNIIIATGGGVVVREPNIAKLKQNGLLVWLTADIDTLLKRIGDDDSRPLLKGKTRRQDLEITLAERTPLYQKAADITIDTENRTPEAVAELIAATKICCLIGDPVEHSLSPLIHNTAYKALGINYGYITIRSGHIDYDIAQVRARGIRGVSVTTPHKVEVMKYLDRIDPAAKGIGAVNTIVNDNGVLTGYNTDGEGALKALEEVTDLNGKKIVLVGSGGAALAIAAALKEKNVNLIVLNRTEAKARRLADKFGAEDAGSLDKLSLVAEADILINATTVGMSPGTKETPVPQEFLHPRLTVFDIVYNPMHTKLLREAQAQGCNIVYGYKMLLYQAASQFELFTGRPAPIVDMESALVKALGGG
ncbi:MAG TPA: shikimate dehydrogenase [Dehalococcoidales bacterium]|nr:shikimate dehydrogenase [Dehalococcoidales bacterium]